MSKDSLSQDFISHVFDTPDRFASLNETEKAQLTKEVSDLIRELDHGTQSDVEKTPTGFQVNTRAKKAILLHFRLQKMELIEVGPVIREAKQKFKFKFVGVCYDLIPIFYPQFIVPGYREKLTSHFVNMVWNAQLVMCISKYSQKQMQFFAEDICLKKIETDYFYLGSEMSTERQLSQSSISPGYSLYVSTIEPRKNHELLYKVWDLLVQKHGKEKVPKLIFVRKRGWLIDNLLAQIEKNPNTHDNISIQERVSDSALAQLYQGALFTLFPSYVEQDLVGRVADDDVLVQRAQPPARLVGQRPQLGGGRGLGGGDVALHRRRIGTDRSAGDQRRSTTCSVWIVASVCSA